MSAAVVSTKPTADQCHAQVLWQQLASVTALVFAAALRRILEVQSQMDLQPRCVVAQQYHLCVS